MARANRIKTVWLILLICLLAVLSAAVQGQSYSSRQIRGGEISRAYQKLMQADLFNFGGVGWGQEITPEEQDFNTLFESLDSVRLFQRLINEGNPEGQMYGLFGLHLKHRAMFRAAAEKLRANGGALEKSISIEKRKVRVAHGCIFFSLDREVLTDQIAKGEWDDAFKSHHPVPPF